MKKWLGLVVGLVAVLLVGQIENANASASAYASGGFDLAEAYVDNGALSSAPYFYSANASLTDAMGNSTVAFADIWSSSFPCSASVGNAYSWSLGFVDESQGGGIVSVSNDHLGGGIESEFDMSYYPSGQTNTSFGFYVQAGPDGGLVTVHIPFWYILDVSTDSIGEIAMARTYLDAEFSQEGISSQYLHVFDGQSDSTGLGLSFDLSAEASPNQILSLNFYVQSAAYAYSPVSAVPLPGTLLFMGSGVFGLVSLRGLRRKLQ